MRKNLLTAAGCMIALAFLPSCLGSEVEDYSEWRTQNDDYLNNLSSFEYTRISPSWAPHHSIFMKWHNDRSLTMGNLSPLSTSTVSVTYRLTNIEGTTLDTSYKVNGDSLYTSTVNANVVGFQIGLQEMHVGDSVTMILPYSAAYGNVSNGTVRPYSNLIYEVKMVDIPALEKPNN